MEVTRDTPTDLELAQQGAIEAAAKIAETTEKLAHAAAEKARILQQIQPATQPRVLSANTENDAQDTSPTFPKFSSLPHELQVRILYFSLPLRRLVRILSDNYLDQVYLPISGLTTIQTILRAKAEMFISPLVLVNSGTQDLLPPSNTLTGFRLSYIPLRFSFENDTLFFEDAQALISLLGAVGEHEERDPEEEEHLVEAFNENGPRNVVLAGPVASYRDLYSIIAHFAWVDTLIMEEPKRTRTMSHTDVAGHEDRIRHDLENYWTDVRGAEANLPLVRFLPAQNLELMKSVAASDEPGISY